MEKSAEGDPRLQTRRQQQGDDPYSLKELLGIQVSDGGSIIRIHLGCVVDQTRPTHMKSVRLLKAGRRQLFLDVVGLSLLAPLHRYVLLLALKPVNDGKRMSIYIYIYIMQFLQWSIGSFTSDHLSSPDAQILQGSKENKRWDPTGRWATSHLLHSP